jgi:hypothetical protein
MTTKLVVNGCYGGFELSLEAAEQLLAAGCGKLISVGRQSAYWFGPRHDARLVEVVERLGEAASGACASLEVLQVDGPYRLVEHDGLERVETPSTIKWVSV